MKRLLFFSRIILLCVPLTLAMIQYRVKPDLEKMAEQSTLLGPGIAKSDPRPLTEAQIKSLMIYYSGRISKLEEDFNKRDLLAKTFGTPATMLALLISSGGALLLTVAEFAYDRRKEERNSRHPKT